MQQKQQQRNQNQQPQQQQQKRKPPRKLTLNKSAPESFESTKRRSSLDQGQGWPNGAVAITKKPYRGGTKDDTPKPARSSSTMQKSEKRSNKETTTDELGLPRGVTMRPSGKWVRNSSACAE
jgi:hypothetical protein